MSETPELFIAPIEIREGLTIKIQLPVDLTEAEAQRIARVVIAYATLGTQAE